MFESQKVGLKDLLKDADEGRLQLPDFQRDFVWDDDDIRSLIASIAKGFPVGALLTLQTGGDVTFKSRLLSGVGNQEVEPKELLLDGQQRITSLYQAMYSHDPVRTCTKNKKIERFYYIDIEKAVNGSERIDDAIEGIPGDKIRRRNFGREIELDLSSTDAEFESSLFPLNRVYDNRRWFYDWRDYWKERNIDHSDLEQTFYKKIIERFEQYQMPFIRLDNRNSREAICLVFEKVNVGGKKLDAFELLTSIFAADNFDLRKDWYGSSDSNSLGRYNNIVGESNSRGVLSKVAKTDFLQACTLLYTWENRLDKKEERNIKDLPPISCRRDVLLGLPLQAYRNSADSIEKGFIEAGRFLNEHKIISSRDIPYPTQIVALAATFAILKKDNTKDATSAVAKEKLSRWFWSVALGELYGSTVESRLARDVSELLHWLSGGDTHPYSIDEAIFQQDRLLSLRTRQSAAYKGLHALIMRHGCRDFITGRETDIMTFSNDNIDIHHIFPKSWCEKQGISKNTFDSIVNKTPLSRESNQIIGGGAPSVYLNRIEKKYQMTSEKLDNILRGHLIDPSYLRVNNFKAFFNSRMEALANVVEKAMGKPVVRDQKNNEKEEDFDILDEEELARELENT